MRTEKILLIDDRKNSEEPLIWRLKTLSYQIDELSSCENAVEEVNSIRPDIILLDLERPFFDGGELIKEIKQHITLRNIPFIIISMPNQVDAVIRCMAIGADSYFTRPFQFSLLGAKIHACLERKLLLDREERYRKQVEVYNRQLLEKVDEVEKEVALAQLGTIFSLSKLAESRDPETGEHIERMAEYCEILAVALQKDSPYKDMITDEFITRIHDASPLHDIGKVGIPDRILQKPGKLTDEEFAIMKKHSVIGADTLQAVAGGIPNNSILEMGIHIAMSHHEKWDGSGYPHGLKGNDIPLSARILALGDVYDALTSRRCYKEPFSHNKSYNIIVEGREKHFDPYVVDAFINTEESFKQVRQKLEDSAKNFPEFA